VPRVPTHRASLARCDLRADARTAHRRQRGAAVRSSLHRRPASLGARADSADRARVGPAHQAIPSKRCVVLVQVDLVLRPIRSATVVRAAGRRDQGCLCRPVDPRPPSDHRRTQQSTRARPGVLSDEPASSTKSHPARRDRDGRDDRAHTTTAPLSIACGEWALASHVPQPVSKRVADLAEWTQSPETLRQADPQSGSTRALQRRHVWTGLIEHLFTELAVHRQRTPPARRRRAGPPPWRPQTGTHRVENETGRAKHRRWTASWRVINMSEMHGDRAGRYPRTGCSRCAHDRFRRSAIIAPESRSTVWYP